MFPEPTRLRKTIVATRRQPSRCEMVAGVDSAGLIAALFGGLFGAITRPSATSALPRLIDAWGRVHQQSLTGRWEPVQPVFGTQQELHWLSRYPMAAADVLPCGSGHFRAAG